MFSAYHLQFIILKFVSSVTKSLKGFQIYEVDRISKLKFTKGGGENSVNNNRFTVPVLCTLSDNLIILYICSKFNENIIYGFKLIKQTLPPY